MKDFVPHAALSPGSDHGKSLILEFTVIPNPTFFFFQVNNGNDSYVKVMQLESLGF